MGFSRQNFMVAAAALALSGAGMLHRRDDEGDRVIEARDDALGFKALYLGSPRRPDRHRSISAQDRSRYMPHIGAKERARHAGKPDGPMHKLPPLFRA